MKININFVYSFLFIIIISVVVIEFHNNNVLESRINSLNKNSTDFNSEKTFKEDYYITQQSHDTNLILVVFASLIAFTGLFTYLNVLERYNTKVNEIKNEIQLFKTEWDVVHSEIDKLKADFWLESAELDSERAYNFSNIGEMDKNLTYKLSSLNKMTDYYFWHLKTQKDEKFAEVIVKSIIKELALLTDYYKDNINFDKITGNSLDSYIT
jgi:hypothetical protein